MGLIFRKCLYFVFRINKISHAVLNMIKYRSSTRKNEKKIFFSYLEKKIPLVKKIPSDTKKLMFFVKTFILNETLDSNASNEHHRSFLQQKLVILVQFEIRRFCVKFCFVLNKTDTFCALHGESQQ